MLLMAISTYWRRNLTSIRTATLTSLALFWALFTFKVDAACVADTRTNNSPNSVLTSTKLNADFNALYDRLNGNLDGECLQSASITSTQMAADSITATQIASGSVTFLKIGEGAYKADVKAKTANYTATTSDDVIHVDASSGDVTITLPTAVGITDKIFVIKKTSTATTSSVTVDPDGVETIDGDLTRSIHGAYGKLAVISDGSNWQTFNSQDEAVAWVWDQKAANTGGGTFTCGSWQTRTLNTTSGQDGFISLSSNQVTLQPGTYHIYCTVPGYGGTNNSLGSHKSKWYDISSTADALIGSSEGTQRINSHSVSQTTSFVDGVISPSSVTVYELQHRCSSTSGSDGFGVAANMGVVEIYAKCRITKVK